MSDIYDVLGTHVSRNLKWSELASKDGVRYPAEVIEWAGGIVPRSLGTVFEVIRGFVGKPLTITSGYRTPAHNKKVGGVPNSQHVQGRAIDIKTPTGMDFDAFATLVKEAVTVYNNLHGAADLLPVRFVQFYPSSRFVHVDIRLTETLVVRYADGEDK